MSLNLSFLSVGNADCMVALPKSRKAVVVDIGDVFRAEKHLRGLGIDTISLIYITHEHRDHVPTVVDLQAFLARWLGDGHSVGRVRLPPKIIESWSKSRKNMELQGKSKAALLVKVAMQKLADYDRRKQPAILGHGRGEEPHRDGDLAIDVLHPSSMFLESEPEAPPNSNEASMVLRLSYGQFAAMLLGDLDGRGAEECALLSQQDPDLVRAHVVKIPHHGAWPRSKKAAKALVELLKAIRPELAVLSVGSSNPHGHVKPDLFSCLLDLKASFGLQSFVCTEATRTCMLSPAEGLKLGQRGMSEIHRCAGNITVKAETSGKWELVTEEPDHPARVRAIPFAACARRALPLI